jgi:hypothetical protein
MSDRSASRNLSRRQVMAGIGVAGMVLTHPSVTTVAQQQPPDADQRAIRLLTVAAMKSLESLQQGDWIETAGFHSPGDGGAAWYQVVPANDQISPNEADVIALENGLLAVLQERRAVHYRMFGARGDGQNDDGIQIKLAHEYANRHQVPVINTGGEFWIVRTVGIPITTNVCWGKTVLHIDERYNSRRVPRFVVHNDRPTLTLTDDQALKAALIEKLKPGVQIIPELADYAGHLLIVLDSKDRIGIRAGYEGNRGWAREEFFYVEEEGRLIGDIAWGFRDLTSVRAIPCNENYLIIQGGGFLLSGDTPERGTPGYYQNGISVERSRTIIREQWMGLEPGKRDVSLEPRSGFYRLSNVYDVTLENIRAMPWEKSRRPPETAVQHGTYGIGGARMLNCTFRNLTAEGGWVAWGVFGTNLNKNFRLEHCRLNRVDVHFHCWNLSITDCTIGFKGITVTGGGELVIENTTRHGNNFIGFRQDYGAKWDGPIRLRGCTLKPSSNSRVSVLSMRPGDFDYQYPIGFGRSIAIEDLTIDYSAAPQATAPCLLLDVARFSKTRAGTRLFFPQRLTFRNIAVTGREQGVRLIQLPDPYHFDLGRSGGCDADQWDANCILVCDNVQLERSSPSRPDDPGQSHLVLGGGDPDAYADHLALYPKIVFIDCDHVSVHLAGCAASVFFQRCSVNTVAATGLRGELVFTDCRFRPDVRAAGERFYALDSTLGTRLTNCTIHAPVVGGEPAPEAIDQIGFLEINGAVRHYQLNTALGNDVLRDLRARNIELTPEFIARLKCHHALEE